jgi:predicted amidohydrolase
LGYQSATAPEFTPARVGEINIGFLIGAELTMPENAQAYRGAGLHLLVTPRATAASEFRRHLAAARSAAMQTGAFELSSNRTVGATHESSGWIIAPSGDTLALTSDECPFISRAIELSVPSIDAKTNDR